MASRSLVLLLPGCAELTRKDAVPAQLQGQATVAGMTGVRYWADQDPTDFVHAAEAAFEREQAEWRASGHQAPLPPAEFLAISGGGEDGAFGAGLLVGWSAAGTRPKFKGVTGISTGALTAPFAFLGPAYDDKLREVYTKISAGIFSNPGPTSRRPWRTPSPTTRPCGKPSPTTSIRRYSMQSPRSTPRAGFS